MFSRTAIKIAFTSITKYSAEIVPFRDRPYTYSYLRFWYYLKIIYLIDGKVWKKLGKL